MGLYNYFKSMTSLRLQRRNCEMLGDFRRRQASHLFKFAMVLLPANVLWLWSLKVHWASTSGFIPPILLIGITLVLLVFGAVTLITPPLCYFESIFHPHTVSSPKAERTTFILGFFGSYLFALIPAINAMVGLRSGRVRFSKPLRVYDLATNAEAYWQGIFIWFGISLLLLFIVSVCWYFAIPRYRKHSNSSFKRDA